MDFKAGKLMTSLESVLQLTRLLALLNEANLKTALRNLEVCLERGFDQNLDYSMYEEDLAQLYGCVEANGINLPHAQTLISFLANQSSNYPVLALLRNSLDSQSSEFISYQVYSGLTQMIAESQNRSKAQDKGIQQIHQSIGNLLNQVPESLVVSSPRSSLLYFKSLSFGDPKTFNAEFEKYIQTGLVETQKNKLLLYLGDKIRKFER